MYGVCCISFLRLFKPRGRRGDPFASLRAKLGDAARKGSGCAAGAGGRAGGHDAPGE